jgi:hypothetical protein
MRVVLAAAAILLAASSFPAHAACPANATDASMAVWPPSSIPTGVQVSGTHPCGRKITCNGGRAGQKATRICRWQ